GAPAERTKERAVTHHSRVPAKRASRRRPCARCCYARASRDPGATSCDLSVLMLRLASLFALGPRKSGLPDLRAFERRSRASPRSVSRSASLHSPGTRELRRIVGSAPAGDNERHDQDWYIYAFGRACAACTSSQMRVGVSGSSRGCTPSVPSALAMALAMTPPAAMMPPSPAPLAPSGLIGEG